MMNILHRTTAMFAVIFLFGFSFGCTAIGAGVGAAIPGPKGEEVPADIRTMKPGSEVTVTYYRPPDQRGGGHLRIDGIYRGTTQGSVILERGENSYFIPLSRIEDTRYRPESSTDYSEEGAITGAAIDVSLILVATWMTALHSR